jgi:hypothetical protein
MKTTLHEQPVHRLQARGLLALLPALLLMAAPVGRCLANDATSSPLDVRIELLNGQPRLQWLSAPGQVYDVEVRTNVSQIGWSKAETLEATAATTTWTDTAPLTASRFYRVAYQVPAITAQVTFTHASLPSGIPDLSTATFASVRDRLKQLAAGGNVALPLPVPDLAMFDTLALSGALIHIDDLQRTVAISGGTTVRGQPAQTMFVGAWEDDDTSAAKGFNFGIQFPQFQLGDWVSGLSGSVFDDLTLDSSVLTLATAPMNLNLSGFAGNAAGFYGGPTLNVRPGLNINRVVNLAQAPRLAGPLNKLGFTDTTAMLEGFLGIDPNALLHAGGPTAAPLLNLRAKLPTTQPSVFPTWLRPKERILEFTNNPALLVRLIDILEATPDGQTNTFMASTEIDTSGGQVSVTVSGSLVEPWEQPFGIHWLTLNQASLSLTFSDSGPAVVALVGSFTAGNQTVTTELTLTETGSANSASFVATVDQITLGDVLHLLADLTGAAPFGDNLPDDALVLSNVRLAFDSSDAQSVTISATSTILGTVQTDVLFSFVQPESGQPLLILGLRVHDFKLSALYSGVNGTLAGDLEFPGVAFTIAQELPDPPSEPIQIPSGNLDPAELDFFEQIHGTAPFVLEVKAGVTFSGTFPQSRLPAVVLDALGMDPNGKILLEGGLGLRLGALTGGGLVALDSLNLKATLPPPTRPRLGFPDWLGNLESGARVLEFTYITPDIEVSITDIFEVDLDGARRTFVTSTTLATDGQQAEITLTGDMIGGWAQPFGVDWLTLNTIGFVLTGDGTTASAALHSTFPLGNKTIALDMGISGNASNQLVRFRGSVDSLSLSDFIELARKQLGSDADPFGDSNFDFTFTNVTMNIEVGSRRSFSLGGYTSLNGKPTRCLFSAIPRPGGGLPQIITGFQFKNWSLGDALPELEGSFLDDFQFDTSSLVFSKGEGTTHSDDMDPETRSFYGEVYEGHSGGGGGGFSVPFHNGLGLIGTAPLQGNPLKGGLDAMGASADSLLMTGTLPGGILGLGGGGGLSGLSLTAGLPPISVPDAPDWFIDGQVGLQITAQPSVGFVGAITVNIEGEILTFNVSAEIQRVGVNVEFALTGGLAAQEPWVNPFGIEWLIFNNATVKVAVSAIGSITLGFAGDMVIGEKDIDTAVALTLSPAGVPTNFIFDGASDEGVTMADLVMLQQQMARVQNTNAPVIPLDALPNMAVRNVHLKFAPRGDPDLGVEAGFAIEGALWIPSEPNGPPDRNFASVTNRVDLNGIVAQGYLGAFVLGPITWSDAVLDLVLTLPDQHLFAGGAAEAGSFFSGNLDVSMTRTGLSFSVTTEIYDQFQAQLNASAVFSLDNPNFTVHGLLQNDFGGTIVPSLTSKVKARANASISIADDLLRRGLTGWTAFRSNPNSTNFSPRITGFAAAAEWDIDQWQPFVNAIHKSMHDIVAASPSTPSGLLDKALNGYTTGGIPGIKTTILGQDFCNGVPYPGGPCWTVPPITIGGVCHDPVLSFFDIPCTTTPFIEQKLIPPLIARIDNILQNQNRSPMIIIERAEFTSSLDGLASIPSVTLASRIRFMQAATRLNLSTVWNFGNQDGSLNTLRDALVNAL